MSNFLDAAKKNLENLVKGSPLNPSAGKQPVKKVDVAELKMDSVYKVYPDNWYSAKPYGFLFTGRDGKKFVMFLPINPSNLTITTSFATNIIPTLYGTVEEHSEVRYYDISIEGTTGMAPKYATPVVYNNTGMQSAINELNTQNSGRSSFTIYKSLDSAAGGFFAKTLGVINKVANKALDTLNGAPKPEKAFTDDQSGYVAFHNLYRFLMRYKADTAGIGVNGSDGASTLRTEHPLKFFNHKDGHYYDVAIRSFTLRRSAENPMLYYYSIQLRGYNLSDKDMSKVSYDLNDRKKQLGLDGVSSSSKLNDFKTKVSNVKSVLSGALGGIDVLGR